MIVNFGVKHNMIGLMKDFGPGKGDPLQYAKSIFPNAFSAEEDFLKAWRETEIDIEGNDRLHITIFIDHTKTDRPPPSEKLAKTKEGYSCAVYLGLDDMVQNGTEKTRSEIGKCLEKRVKNVIAGLKNIRSH